MGGMRDEREVRDRKRWRERERQEERGMRGSCSVCVTRDVGDERFEIGSDQTCRR